MVSSTFCYLVSLYGMLKHSWLSFKLLKDFQLHQGVSHREAGEAKAHEQAFVEVKMKDMRKILQFWTVFALYSLYEFYLEVFIFWIPFYYSLKLVGVVWLMLPETQGSATVFSLFVEPVMIRHSEWFENVFLPAVHAFVCDSEAALVGSVKSALSTDKLNISIDHFENLLGQLRSELLTRAKPDDKDTIGDSIKQSQRKESASNKEGSKSAAQGMSVVSLALDGVGGTGDMLRIPSDNTQKQDDVTKVRIQVVEALELDSQSETEFCSIGENDLSSDAFDEDVCERKEEEESATDGKTSDVSPSKLSPNYVDTMLGLLKGIRDISPLKPRVGPAKLEQEDSQEGQRNPRKLPPIAQNSRPITRGYSRKLTK